MQTKKRVSALRVSCSTKDICLKLTMSGNMLCCMLCSSMLDAFQ